ncbi:MAG: VOC family protein [Bacteroidia bacterium]|nr:VOC family protein [Bacteroidia bacterium]MDW8159254.1 VOC family protein [Bacteroidia bacterium]
MLDLVKIKETCIYVSDLERTKNFYHSLLELPVISFVPGKHVFFRAGSSVLLCFIAEDSRQKIVPPPHYGYGQLHFAFEVPPEKYEAAKAFVQSKGIAIEYEQNWPGGFHSFYFRDPDGHCLEVVPTGMWFP